jgi:hypothetical protein
VLFLQVRAPDQDGVGGVEIGNECPIDRCGQKMGREGVVETRVDIVGFENDPGELGEGIGVLIRPVRAAYDRKRLATVFVPDQAKALRHSVECIRPGGFHQLTVFADKGLGEPLARGQILESEAVLVRKPAMVGGVVVDPDQTEDLVLADLHREPGMGGVVHP